MKSLIINTLFFVSNNFTSKGEAIIPASEDDIAEVKKSETALPSKKKNLYFSLGELSSLQKNIEVILSL